MKGIPKVLVLLNTQEIKLHKNLDWHKGGVGG